MRQRFARFAKFSALLIVVLIGGLTAAPQAYSQAPRTVTIAHPGPIYTMDSPVTWFGSTHWLTMLMGDCLLWRGPDLKGYVPQLAERWENTGPDRWRFTIRRGATFHNGEPINAETIKWNIDRVRSRRDFMVNPQWQFIKDTVVVNETTLDVVTDGPKPYTEFDISFNGCNILPPRYIAQVGEREFARRPIGSGPFRLVEFREGERYVFEAWDGYWGGRPRGVDRIVYQVIPDQATQVAALLSGQVDLVPNVGVTDVGRVRSAPNLKLIAGASGNHHNLILRTANYYGDMSKHFPNYLPVTVKKEVRQAISAALDRRVLAKVQGFATPSLARVTCEYSDVPRNFCGEKAAAEEYNPARARRLLERAGYSGNNKPTVFFDTANFQIGNEKEVAEAIKAQLEEVGFVVNLNVTDLASYNTNVTRTGRNRDLALVPLGGSPSLVPLFYRCEWPRNSFYHACDRSWQQVGNAILKEMDTKKRAEMWAKWWSFFRDQAGTLPLYEIQRQYGMSQRIDWKPRSDGWITPRDITVR
jgi:peptide/nickel transport system substrate-binding protein